MRYALINKNGEVVNIITWDGETEFPLPEGCKLVEATKEHDNKFADYSSSQIEVPKTETENLTQVLLDKGIISESDIQNASADVVK